MRRAAHSIGANLAEGAGRITRGEFRQFVSHATGSTFEVEWHTTTARDLHYGSPALLDRLESELDIQKRALHRFAQTLR
jgi:four helix bundle protein